MGFSTTKAFSLPSRTTAIVAQNKLVTVFVTTHLLFAIFLGRLFALAPDERGYLYTFNNLYGSKDPNPQYNSGWITAPKPFLWLAYIPAKILNLVGVPDYLSIRILSISIATLSLVLVLNMHRRFGNENRRFENFIFIFFFIPSIFLWTTVGLREVFILAEISLILVGLDHLFRGLSIRGISYLSLGSYALLSTKNYLWVCLIISAFIVSVVLAFTHNARKKLLKLGVGLVLIPCIAFACTTSVYALQFLISSAFHSDLTAVGARSGDSVVQVAIPNSQYGLNGITPDGSSTISTSGKDYGSTLVTFHGDTTLITLHFYLIEHPDAWFTVTLRSLGITEKIDEIWNAKLKMGLIKKTVKALPESSSISGYMLKPGRMRQPGSVIRPAFLFMFGPIPLLDQGGLALDVVALESPLWWLLYGAVLYRLVRYRKNGYLREPVFMLASTYFLSLVVISALVEVNLGTSFRHRSILLIPLMVMFIRARRKTTSVVN